MLEFLLALLSALGTGYCILLLRSYEFLSVSELKRQARDGSRLAKHVYEIRGVHPSHVVTLLWACIGLFYASMIIFLGIHVWGGFVVVLSALVAIILFVIVPRIPLFGTGLGMASVSVPVLKRVLLVAKPALRLLDTLVSGWGEASHPKQLHSKEELLEILRSTQISKTPFSKDELSIAVHALTFGDIHITEIMTPRSVVKYVRASDILSPVLLGELHESGYSRFPVIESERGQFVGVLYSKDLSDLRANRSVHEVMRPELYYVNEFTSLDNVLNAFLRTQHHLFLVVNEFEEVVGIITIEDVLEQIIGRKIVDEFDQYADLRAVAKQLARESAKHRHGESV